MERKRKTEITIETEQVLIIRKTGQPSRAWCAMCAAEVSLVPPEEAALLTEVSLRAICRQVEAGQLHFRETADGRLFICLDSLSTKSTANAATARARQE